MSQNTFSKKTTSLHADEGDKRMSFHRNVSESLALEHDTSCFTSTTLSGNCCRFSLRSSTHSTLVSRILQCIKGDEIGNSFILRVCTKLFHPALVALVRRRRGLWSLVLNGGRSMEVNGAWVVPFVAVDRVGERQSRGVQR